MTMRQYPYKLQSNQELKPPDLDSRRDFAILNNIIPELQERQALQTVPFMQDGAPSHIALPLQSLIRSPFGDDRIISHYFNYAWPPRSPDLTPCDFRLWVFLRSKVYRHQPASLASARIFLS
ncbi:uncharacterized protein TNCV_389211 [Trichonephila clavipes]|nr:uncharacterized protein TNCV_389211 [Trichonephila clavipes]